MRYGAHGFFIVFRQIGKLLFDAAYTKYALATHKTSTGEDSALDFLRQLG